MANFCTIRPANDAAALELSTWCAAVLPAIAHAGHAVTHDLYATAAIRRAAGNSIAGVRCVLFFGHGSDTELLGAQNSALIDTLNVAKASGAIFVAIACSSASVLGPDAIQKGVHSYLGFDSRFAWISRDPDNKFQPAATGGILQLISGSTTADAFQLMFAAFGDVVDYYLNGAGKGKTNSTIGWLTAFWSQQHLQMLGDNSAIL
jgi:hypothetical protein